MSLTFFGTDADIASVWKWVFDVPGMRIVEEYSKIDCQNRWFDSPEEALAYLRDPGHSLAAWPEFAGGRPRAEKVELTRATQRELGGKVRTVLHSPAMIRITKGNDQNGCLASATVSCWSEKGARQRSIYSSSFLDEVDWAALRSAAGKIQRMISKASPAKMRSYPIMPDAFDKLASGEQPLWNWGAEVTIASPLIVRR